MLARSLAAPLRIEIARIRSVTSLLCFDMIALMSS